MSGKAMARQTLLVHWKTLRWPLAGLAVLAFALPLLATHSLAQAFRFFNDAGIDAIGLSDVRMEQAVWAPLIPLLAAVVGSVTALGVWYWDHREGHTYALALPIERWRYVLLKLGGGAVLVGLVSVAFGVGSAAAAARLAPPTGLETQPILFTLRFLMAALTVYALVFAMAAGTIPTMMKTLVAVGAVGILFVAVYPVLAETGVGIGLAGAGEWLERSLTEWPGPFAILAGPWSLVGV